MSVPGLPSPGRAAGTEAIVTYRHQVDMMVSRRRTRTVTPSFDGHDHGVIVTMFRTVVDIKAPANSRLSSRL